MLYVGYDRTKDNYIKSKIIEADSIEEASKQSSTEVVWKKAHELFKREVLITVDNDDIDTLITHIYGHEFESAADLESSNDTVHRIIVKKGELVDDMSILEFRKTGEELVSTSDLMCDMCDKGIIEEGTYIIEVSW